MKKISILFSALAMVVGANAQRAANFQGAQASKPTVASATELENSRIMTDRQVAVNRGGGGILFTEDFDNGLDGNNGGVGAWTAEDSGATPIWMVANSNSPGGEFSSTIAALNSTTAANGWMIFDCDLYNTPISDGVEDVTGSLTSPVLDFSGAASVVVEWQQYFRYCCFSASPLTIEVSSDAGATWTVFPAQGNFVPSANTLSANPQLTSVDVSCAAANQASVQIRFGYNTAGEAGYSHYFWGIDDVVIRENLIVNDLEVRQVTNGDIFNLWEYRVTPFEQRTLEADGGLLAGVIYRNNGNADQANTVVTVEILDEAQTVLSTTTTDAFLMEAFGNTAECPSFLFDTLYVETGWVPAAQGTYTVRATISSENADEVNDNDISVRTIVYSEYEYGHDDESDLGLEVGPRESDDSPGEFDPTGYGNFYTFPNAGSEAYGLSVVFGPTCSEGVEFNATLTATNGDLNGAGEVIASGEFQTTAGQLNSEYQYYPFEESVTCETDDVQSYFCAVQNPNTSELELTVAAQANSDNDNSTASYELAGSGEFVWFGSQNWSPAVRLILAELVSVDEVESDNLEFFQINPNPARDVARINFALKSQASVVYEVRDINGRLIEWNRLGGFQAGQNNFELNVSNYSVGNYTVSLVIDGQKMFSKKMSVIK
jgi:hypothetical protein